MEFLTVSRRQLRVAKKMRVALVNAAAGSATSREEVGDREQDVELAYAEVVETAVSLEVLCPAEIHEQVEVVIKKISELWSALWTAWAATEGSSQDNVHDALADAEKAEWRARKARGALVELVREHLAR